MTAQTPLLNKAVAVITANEELGAGIHQFIIQPNTWAQKPDAGHSHHVAVALGHRSGQLHVVVEVQQLGDSHILSGQQLAHSRAWDREERRRRDGDLGDQVHNILEAPSMEHGKVEVGEHELRIWVVIGIRNNLNSALTGIRGQIKDIGRISRSISFALQHGDKAVEAVLEGETGSRGTGRLKASKEEEEPNESDSQRGHCD